MPLFTGQPRTPGMWIPYNLCETQSRSRVLALFVLTCLNDYETFRLEDAHDLHDLLQEAALMQPRSCVTKLQSQKLQPPRTQNSVELELFEALFLTMNVMNAEEDYTQRSLVGNVAISDSVRENSRFVE